MPLSFNAKFLTVEERVVQQTIIVRPDGAGACEDTWDELCLIRTYRFFGLPVIRFVIDRETIPAYAVIEKGALGYTDWTSQKFFAKINGQNTRQRAAAGFIT